MTPAVPLAVQPLSEAASKPPLVTPPPPPVAIIVSVKVTLWVAAAPVPVTVTVYIPGGVVLPAATVSVDPAPALIGFGLKLAVAPDGRPVAPRVTLWAAPLVIAVLTAAGLPPPCATLMAFGVTEI